MKQYSNQVAKGEGVIFKRTMTDDKVRRMGLKPSLFENRIYKKMHDIKVMVSNSPTKVPVVPNALFGGMTPPKNGRQHRVDTFRILHRLLPSR